DDPSAEGNQQFTFILTDVVGSIGSIGNPSAAIITIIDDDPPGSTNSVFERVNPGEVPPHDDQLRVFLQAGAGLGGGAFGGQWKLGWETAWRDSGTSVGGLSAGNYEIVFKPVSGFLPPANMIVSFPAGGSLTNFSVTNVYTPNGSAN